MSSASNRSCLVLALALWPLAACPLFSPTTESAAAVTPVADAGADGGAPAADGGAPGDAGTDCQPCVSSAECGEGSACVQLLGTDTCARVCGAAVDCGAAMLCAPTVAEDGRQVRVCVALGAVCGAASCPPVCPFGTVCDPIQGRCQSQPTLDDGGLPATCGTLDGPATGSCCTACVPGTGSCQANGCFGAWWCERSLCRCQQPPPNCLEAADAGAGGGGPVDAGAAPDAGSTTGTVGINGGTVDRLYFAVVGDTRPALPNDTGSYPTAIITGIYEAIAAMNPRPQFVVGTGDYMYALPTGGAAAAQMSLYMNARARFPGPFFPAMGNHECTGATATNCARDSSSRLVQSFRDAMLQPIARTDPYYALDFQASDSSWTAKFVVIACNMWDQTQKTWLADQLARTTTHTFIVRHIPLGVAAPCTNDSDPMIKASPYTLLLVGHTHTFQMRGREVVEGTGGAPISGNAAYGYATVASLPGGGFKVQQYDSATRQVVGTFVLP
jgi:hypothetical protein